jgi:peptidoglycan hydrolase-like protein with peptidoglycan-binding domain
MMEVKRMKHITVVLVLSIFLALPNLAGGQEMTKGEIRALQKELKDRGVYKGPIDGIHGEATEKAIREYWEGRTGSSPSKGRPYPHAIEQSRPGGCPEGPPCPPLKEPLPRPSTGSY